MVAVGAYLIIEPIKGQTRKRASGLEIPVELEDRFIQGVVHSASPLGKNEFGLEEGQNILYDKHAGHDIKNINGKDYKVIRCTDVAVIMD